MKRDYNTINDDDIIEEFNNVKEENLLVQTSKDLKEEIHKRSSWEAEEEISNSNEEVFLHEISLYDPCKSRDENFEDGISSKYLLVRVENTGSLSIDTIIPDQFSKVVTDLNKMEEYGTPEFMVVDYDTIFGIRLITFINYNSDFFTCDERVFFESLLIKYKAFGYKPFYWSKEVIWRELGIKKDRANRIIKRFIELDILSTEVKKSVLDGRPQQITYFNLQSKKICELLPKIYNERESNVSQITEVKKYLNFKIA
ncbi:hypothetical protein H0I29_12075 [Polaribacter sp. R2A056_3_33]|uniref:hypothetical protein n=1 Tax=Polaribacter sp. R2A056_3_33 TaxID=2745563 RepID=UPI001C4E6366|nr:hypothetical protein [Polaribacter sp. R2A056_3_33]QXP69361.1 hypothetical protein H0I29_12075 [Polaribacter sp. R2A056_3_33]